MSRPKYDVSHLPAAVLDHRSPIWWGNLLMLIIETMMFAVLLVGFFYYRMNFTNWPPPRVDRFPVIYRPVPSLGIPIAGLAVLLFSLVPMIWIDRMCLQRRETAVKAGVIVFILVGLLSIGVRFEEFSSLHYRWDANAYASIVWTLLGVHMMHLMIGTGELIILGTWLLVKGLDDKHARDLRITAVYWYWVVGIWLVIFFVVDISPRILGK
jgi:heme/copper-type cytochrome/quinol oxidase subunit 3